MKQNKEFLLLWFSQSISQLGSSMTAFALTLWIYEKTHLAMSVSLLAFFRFTSFILMGIIAGKFVDKHSKKSIMLISDSIAAIGTLWVLILFSYGRLDIGVIYIANIIVGASTAFQNPAAFVAVGKLVEKDRLAKASGLNSFSNYAIMIMSPILGAALYGFSSLTFVLVLDLICFLFAFIVLAFFINIPENNVSELKISKKVGITDGFRFLFKQKGLLLVVLTIAIVNFFSRITYENILSPMILARGGNQTWQVGVVNSLIGMGGIVGGIIVSLKNGFKRNAATVYIAGAISFLIGDLTMAFGRNAFWWSIAGIAADLPGPFMIAGLNMLIYKRTPEELQGRVFAAKGTLESSIIPAGLLLGGFLADYVFEPFMISSSGMAAFLHILVGEGHGSGMAAMFLITGLSGFLICIWAYRNKHIKALDNNNNQWRVVCKNTESVK